jgi:hypothetical protein
LAEASPAYEERIFATFWAVKKLKEYSLYVKNGFFV